MQNFQYSVGIIGGAGHVGLPLAISFAEAGLKTLIHDVDTVAMFKISNGKMPFTENGAGDRLAQCMTKEMLCLSTTPSKLSECKFIIIVIGTPVDEHMNPNYENVNNLVRNIREHLSDDQIIILRSTVVPGTTERLCRYMYQELKLFCSVAFCPERVSQGNSFEEIKTLPQIVACGDSKARLEVASLFTMICPKVITELNPTEAELMKLLTNAYRYIQFAAVNHFYMIASSHGLDFEKIRAAAVDDYPRLAGMPSAGLAAGPCLIKDTMQLAAFSQNQFGLGHSALLVNEGMPAHMIGLAERNGELRHARCLILGMTFKPNCDDNRDSLSFKLRNLLRTKCESVKCHDPHLDYPGDAQDMILNSDCVFIGVPHEEYADLDFGRRTVINPWGKKK